MPSDNNLQLLNPFVGAAPNSGIQNANNIGIGNIDTNNAFTAPATINSFSLNHGTVENNRNNFQATNPSPVSPHPHTSSVQCQNNTLALTDVIDQRAATDSQSSHLNDSYRWTQPRGCEPISTTGCGPTNNNLVDNDLDATPNGPKQTVVAGDKERQLKELIESGILKDINNLLTAGRLSTHSPVSIRKKEAVHQEEQAQGENNAEGSTSTAAKRQQRKVNSLSPKSDDTYILVPKNYLDKLKKDASKQSDISSAPATVAEKRKGLPERGYRHNSKTLSGPIEKVCDSKNIVVHLAPHNTLCNSTSASTTFVMNRYGRAPCSES